jgi:sortase (surface protein transpeptidase)
VLDISDGEVVDDRWSISDTGVSYLTSSVVPGTAGNSVMYGHNKGDILGGLPMQIKPTQVEILNQSDDTRLTIYTCSGFLDTARFVVVGKLIES